MQHGIPIDPMLLVPSLPSSSSMQVDSSCSGLAAGAFNQQAHHSWAPASTAAAAAHMMGPSLSLSLQEQQQQQPSASTGATPADSYGNDSGSSGSRLLVNPVAHMSGLQQLVPARNDPPKPRGRSGPKSKFSPYIGVSQYKRTGRWEAHIWDSSSSTKGSRATGKSSKGKQLHLGSFLTAAQAARAYDRAALLLRGPHAALNFPLEDYSNDPVLEELSHMSRTDLVLALRKTCDMELEAAALEAFNAKVPAAAAHILHNITGPNPAADPNILGDQQQQQLLGFVDLYGNALDTGGVAAPAAAAAEPDSMGYGGMDGLQQQGQTGLVDDSMGTAYGLAGFPQPLAPQLQQQQQGLWLQQTTATTTPTDGLDLSQTTPFHLPGVSEPPAMPAAAGTRILDAPTQNVGYWSQQDVHTHFQVESSAPMPQHPLLGSSMPLTVAPVTSALQQTNMTTAQQPHQQQVFGFSSAAMQPVSSGLLASGTDTYSQQQQQQQLLHSSTPFQSSTAAGPSGLGPLPPASTYITNLANTSVGAPLIGSRQTMQQQQQRCAHPTSSLPSAHSAPLPMHHTLPNANTMLEGPTGCMQQQQHLQLSGITRLAPMASAPLSGLQGPPSSGHHCTDPGQPLGAAAAGGQLTPTVPVMTGTAASKHHGSSRPSTPQTARAYHQQQQPIQHTRSSYTQSDHHPFARPQPPMFESGSPASQGFRAATDSRARSAAAATAAGGTGVWQPTYAPSPPAAAAAAAAAAAPAPVAAGQTSWQSAAPALRADSSTSSSGRTGGSSSNITSNSDQQQHRLAAYQHGGSQSHPCVASLPNNGSTHPPKSHSNQQQQHHVVDNQYPPNSPHEQNQPSQSVHRPQQQQSGPAVTRCSVSGSAGTACNNSNVSHSLGPAIQPIAVQQHQYTNAPATLSPHACAAAESPAVITRALSPQPASQQQQHWQQQHRALVPSRGASPTAIVEGQLCNVHIAAPHMAHHSSMKALSSNPPAAGHTWQQQQHEQQRHASAEVEVPIVPATTAGLHTSMRFWGSPSDEVHSASHNSSAMLFTAGHHRPAATTAAAVRAGSLEPPVDRRSTAGSNTNFQFSPPSPKPGVGQRQAAGVQFERQQHIDASLVPEQQQQQQQQEACAGAYQAAGGPGSREQCAAAEAAWQSWQSQQRVGPVNNRATSTSVPVLQAAGTSATKDTLGNQQQQSMQLRGPAGVLSGRPAHLATSVEGSADWADLLHSRSKSHTPDHHQGLPDHQHRPTNHGQGIQVPDHPTRDLGTRSDSAENLIWDAVIHRHQHFGPGHTSVEPDPAAVPPPPDAAVQGGVLDPRPSVTTPGSADRVTTAAAAAAAAAAKLDHSPAHHQQHPSPATGAGAQQSQALFQAQAAPNADYNAPQAAAAAAAEGLHRTISSMTMTNLAPSRTVSSMVLAELARLASLSGSGDHDAATSQLLQATSELAGSAEECQHILQECQHLLYHQHSLPGLDQFDLLLMSNGAGPFGHHVGQHGLLWQPQPQPQQQQQQQPQPQQQQQQQQASAAEAPLSGTLAADASTSAGKQPTTAASSAPPEAVAQLVPMPHEVPLNTSGNAPTNGASPAVSGSSLQGSANSSKRSMPSSTDGDPNIVVPAAKRARSPAPLSQFRAELAVGSSLAAPAAALAAAAAGLQHIGISKPVVSGAIAAADGTSEPPAPHTSSQHGSLGWWEMMQM